MLTKLLLRHSIRAFYPMNVTSNGSLSILSILKDSRVQDMCFFPLDLRNWY